MLNLNKAMNTIITPTSLESDSPFVEGAVAIAILGIAATSVYTLLKKNKDILNNKSTNLHSNK